MTTISREQARELDRRAEEEFGLPGIVLMENAGRGVADTLCRLGVGGKVVVCCGKGNNGGDGFVIARHLDLRGIEVQILTWGWPLIAGGQWPPGSASDAQRNYHIAHQSRLSLKACQDASGVEEILHDADWIVDALLGTGAHGEPRPPLDAVIDAINASGKRVMAVDLPSGLDCDTGQAARHTVRAAHTCTFVANKRGFLAPGASQYTGQVHICDIGAPRTLVEEILGGCRQSSSGAT